MPCQSGDSKRQAARVVLLMMQKELRSLLRVRDEANRKIRTAKVTLQWLESRLGVQQSQTTSFSQLLLAPERPLTEDGVVPAAQMAEASHAFEDSVVST
jgi:hypothetical protein